MSEWLVLKPIKLGAGNFVATGERVLADNWRNRRSLESGRYIQRIEITVPSVVSDAIAEEEVKPVKKVGRPPKVAVEEG
jgi:hypothetical protein